LTPDIFRTGNLHAWLEALGTLLSPQFQNFLLVGGEEAC
jgi:hypothetical protein